MSPRTSRTRVLALVGVLAAAACTRDLDTLGPAQFPTDAGVLAEGFAPGVRFESFSGAKADALSDDAGNAHSGALGLKVTVPAPGDPSGSYAGGAFIANVPRDLSGYNALTFWAKASRSASLDVAGIGNDNTGLSKYTAQASALVLTTGWQQYTIPIPNSAKLTREGGLFFFAEGPENGAGYDIWFDDMQFEKVNTIQNPRPAIAAATVSDEVGAVVRVGGTSVTFSVLGSDVALTAAPGYFSFISSDTTVATVASDGTITLVGAGTSDITALLGTTPASGSVTLVSAAPPAVAAPVPTDSAVNVISLFSNVYSNNPVDTWSASYDMADVADVQIAGDDVKKYTNLVFAGIEFITQQVNASAMTGLHLDLWVQNATQFKVKLVDFGANGAFGGGDDSEHEVTLTPSSTPALTTGSWNSLNIPLSAFTGLTARGHLAQIIISGSSSTAYLDNVYFYKAPPPPPPTVPTTIAPAPTRPSGSVISLFSSVYTNHGVDTWQTSWSTCCNELVDPYTINGHDVKQYTLHDFVGVEFGIATPANTVDASAMTHFHVDLWSPSPSANLEIQLVNDAAGSAAIGKYQAGALAAGTWVSLDIPLASFAGLTAQDVVQQLLFVSTGPMVLYIDNVYFYTAGGSPTLSSIAISPDPVSVAPAGTQQLTVTGTYSDASMANLTAGSTFLSGNTGVATVSGAGLVSGVAVGTTTIIATHTASGLVDTVSVNVATASTGGLVFYGGYASGVAFADFGGADNNVSVDAATMNNGRSSLKAVITGSGGYSGGALVASAPRDLSAFNALTFWAKGSVATSTLKVGLGNNAATTLLNAEAIGIPLTTSFTKFIIPLPDPSKFTSYDGLFHFADGPNNYTVWFNDIQYENLPVGQVGPPTAALAAWPSLTVAVGTPSQMNPAPNTVNWTVPALPNGGKLTDVAWRWFTLTSSNPGVATVSPDGLVTGVSGGTASITATMNGIVVAGSAPITVTAPLAVPTTIAPTPGVSAANVISLFSSAYTNQGVDTWQTGWSTCCNELVDPYTISGHDVKQYTLHDFVGVEFGVGTPANTVNASTMTTFHVDVWSPNPSSNLEIQLVNDATGAAAIGHYQAGAIASGSWVSLEIPLSSFTGLTAKDKLQQLLFVAAGPTVLYIDNVYFHN